MESDQNTPESTMLDGLSSANASEEPISLPVKNSPADEIVVNGLKINRLGLKVCDHELGSAYQQGMLRHVYQVGRTYTTPIPELPFYFLTTDECSGHSLENLPSGIDYQRILLIGYHTSDRLKKYFWFPSSMLTLSDFRTKRVEEEFDTAYSVLRTFTVIEEVGKKESSAMWAIFDAANRLGLNLPDFPR